MADQIIYTINRAIPGHLQSGYGIYSESGNVPEGDRADVLARFSAFKPPVPVSGPDDPNKALVPTALAFGVLASGRKCLAQKTFTGYVYGMPSRYNNYVSHSFVLDSLEGYPIEYFGSPSFCTGIDFDGMDTGSAPPRLSNDPPALREGREIDLEKVRRFVESKGTGFLRTLTYRVLGACGTKDKILLDADWREIPLWVGAVTMLLPKEMAEHVTFATYIHPDNAAGCEESVIGLYDHRKGMLREGTLTSEDAPPDDAEAFDGPFNDYIDKAYSSDKRERFFAFLRRARAERPGKDVIGLYDLQCVTENGQKLSGDSLGRAWEAFKEHYRHLPAEYAVAMVESIADTLGDEDADFVQNTLSPSLSDDGCVRRIRVAVAESRLRGVAGMPPEEADRFYSRNRKSLEDAVRYGLDEALGSAPGAYLAARLWKDDRSDGNRGFASRALESAGDDVMWFLKADRGLSEEILGQDSPAGSALRSSVLSDMMASGIRSSDAARCAGKVGYSPDLLKMLDDHMMSAADAGPYFRKRCEDLIAADRKADAGSVFAGYCRNAPGDDIFESLEFLDGAGKEMADACVPALTERFERSEADFMSEERYKVARTILRVLERSPEELPRTALYLAADSIRDGSEADLAGYDGLSPGEKRSFCRRAFSGKGNMDLKWMTARLAPFAGHETDELYSAVSARVSPTMADGPETLAAYIVALGRTGVEVNDSTFKGLAWRGKPGKLQKSIEKAGGKESDIEAYYSHSSSPREEKKSGFFGLGKDEDRPRKYDDKDEPDDGDKGQRKGFMGWLKRRE